METPSKQSEISTMTYQQEEEMQHEISKLWYQMQQISLSKKVTEAKIDGVNKGVDDKMDGIEPKLKGKI